MHQAQSRVGLREGFVDFERAHGRRFRARHDVVRRGDADDAHERENFGDSRPRFRKTGFERDGFLEAAERFAIAFRGGPVLVVTALEIERVGFRIFVRAPRLGHTGEANAQVLDNGQRDLVLHVEDILHLAIETL